MRINKLIRALKKHKKIYGNTKIYTGDGCCLTEAKLSFQKKYITAESVPYTVIVPVIR